MPAGQRQERRTLIRAREGQSASFGNSRSVSMSTVFDGVD